MVERLTDEEIERFRANLQNRLNELRQGVHEEVVRSDSEHFRDVAGEVHDQEEASVAHLVVDMDLANIDRHVQEIRAMESALLRMARGEYGVCVDCGQPIPRARLEANPTAERCITCQADYERAEALASPSHGSL